MSTWTARQWKALREWINADCSGTIEAYTGFGKTRIGMMAIHSWLKQRPTDSIIVVVPSWYLLEQWTAKINAIEGWSGRVEIKTIHSITINPQDPIECDLLIVDEVHALGADTFSSIFHPLVAKYRHFLGLTATLERLDGRHEMIQQYAPIVDSIPLQEGKDNGWVNPFHVVNVPVYFSAANKRQYNQINQSFYTYFRWFGENFDLVSKVMKDAEERKKYALQMKIPVQVLMGYARGFFNAMRKRQSLLINNSDKLEMTRQIIELVSPSNKVITFSQRVEFARSLHEMTEGSYLYDAKQPAKKRKAIADKFKAEPYGLLHTAKALDEGADFPDINVGIISSGSRSKRQNTQRQGRVLRFVEGKKGWVINLYHPRTADEQSLRSRQGDAAYIQWINSFQELQNLWNHHKETSSFEPSSSQQQKW